MRTAISVAALIALSVSGSALSQTAPSRGRSQSPSSNRSRGSAQSKAPDHEQEAVATVEGVFRGIVHKKILLDDENSNEMEFYVTKKTKWFAGDQELKASQVKSGDRLRIETEPRLDGTMDALNIHVLRDASAKP